MITRKLKITHISDIELVENKSKNFSYALRNVYRNLELSADDQYISGIKQKHGITDIEYRSVVAKAKAMKASETAWKNKTEEKIAEITEQLETDKKLTKREKYKLFNKRAYLIRSLKSEIVFGSKNLLRRITREYNKGKRKNIDRIAQLKAEYNKKRNEMPFFIMGEATRQGNRFYDLSNLSNGEVIYKPHKGCKCNIAFSIPKNMHGELEKVNELVNKGEIPLTISVSREYIMFTYDEEKVNGYGIDETNRRKDVKAIKSKRLIKEAEKEEIKNVYRQYYDEQQSRKLEGKLESRCISVDLNPTNIGVSILEVNSDGTPKIIHTCWYDLSKLSVKLGKSSSHEDQKHLNNKRRYEIAQIWKSIFQLARHYRCSKFIMEDLEFKSGDGGNKEFNRKKNNVWHRVLTERIIIRRCNQCGIELVKVNPCYSSFIGNIQYGYVDAVNASIEIGRRGLTKYINGAIYPHITADDIHTVNAKFGTDVEYGSHGDWVSLYKTLADQYKNDMVGFAQRLRSVLEELPKDSYSTFSVSSYKSKVKIIVFN